ncbi:uncharacterized protein LOC108666868, partial [Hyalella azteca]|uniref:Uncharacterized protein LOC108666868 n=1 Tax=Hyalella azteca TaxID=294128 RepID=A0A979FIR8_HYAAZ
MYVIFPLEDLLEPYSVPNQSPSNRTETPEKQNNESGNSRPPSSTQPSLKAQPDQGIAILTPPEEPQSCASVTSDLKRSGSFRSFTGPISADTQAALLAQVCKDQPIPPAAAPTQTLALPSKRTSIFSIKKSVDTADDNQVTRKKASLQIKSSFELPPKPQGSPIIENDLKKRTDASIRKTPTKSQSFSSIASSYQALHIKRSVTPTGSALRLHPNSLLCTTPHDDSRNLHDKNTNKCELSSLQSFDNSSVKQPIEVTRGDSGVTKKPQISRDLQSNLLDPRAESPSSVVLQRRKKALVNVSVLPKDLGTQQKSAFGGAKDGSICAKEFSYNASSSVGTIAEQEFGSQYKTRARSQNISEGLSRTRYSRDGSISYTSVAIRSDCSVDSSTDVTLAGSSSLRSSNNSSFRSRTSDVVRNRVPRDSYARTRGPIIIKLDVPHEGSPIHVDPVNIAHERNTISGSSTHVSGAAVATSTNSKRPAAPVRTLSTGAAPLNLDKNAVTKSPPSGAVSEFLRTAAAGNFAAIAAPSIPASPPLSARPPVAGTQRKSQTELPSKWTQPSSHIRSPSISSKEKRAWGSSPQMLVSDSVEAGLRRLTHPALSEPLKAHCNVTFKLVKTVSEFSAQLSRLHEHHGEQLQHLVHSFRKRNSELRNERPTAGGPLALAWESLLQEVELDSQLHVDVAATLTRDVARPLVENTFCRKIEARKLFAHRESFETIVSKAEEQLKKSKREYTEAHRQHCQHYSVHACCVQSKREYTEAYRQHCQHYSELEALLVEVGDQTATCLTHVTEVVAAKVPGRGSQQHYRVLTPRFAWSQVPGCGSQQHYRVLTPRSRDAGLNNKANELQEDICLKLFDVRLAQLQLAAVTAQKELFAPRESAGVEGRKMSSSSGGSGMKSKWMKAFKSLKTSSSGHPAKDADRRGGGRTGEMSPPIFDNSHYFQEYTYKKISACDVCHQILKGHSRQGLKCKLCKVSVHPDCQAEAPKCQPKTRLLRRQRSTSDIETKQIEPDEDEIVYGGEQQSGLSFNSLIASQPGRRPLEPPSPTGLSHYPHDQGSGEEVDIIYKVLKQAGDLGGR